jgi:hypothetical protein
MDKAFALGQVVRTIPFAVEDKYEVVITVSGKPSFTSGSLSRQTIERFDQVAEFYARPRERVRAKLLVTKYRGGFPYQAAFPLALSSFPRNNNGKVVLRVVGSAVLSSSAMKKSRRWRVGYSKSTHRRAKPWQRPSDVRPSPEAITRPYLRTLEFFNGSYHYFPTVEPRTWYYREWTGSRTPGWGKKSKTNYVENNHTVRVVITGQNRSTFFSTQPASGNFTLKIDPFTAVYAIPAFDRGHLPNAEFNALRKLISNAQTGIQANLLQNIAQVSQLSSLIVGNATMMVKSLQQLKRGNIPGAIAALGARQVSPKWQGARGNPSVKKSLANNWLQLQYGWKPLLSDIEGFLKIMGNQLGAQDHVVRVRGSASAQERTVANLPLVGPDHPPGKTYMSYRTKVKFQVRFRMDNPLLALFAQTGFTNPINLVWELIPFSFVVDWFLPIGSYLEALSAWDGATFLGGSKTQFTRAQMDSTVAFSGVSPTESTVIENIYAAYCKEEVWLQRTALSSWPSQILPTFRNGIREGVRAQNAIALLVGQMKR